MQVSSSNLTFCNTARSCLELHKAPKTQFYMTIKAYCLLKTDKENEARELLNEIKMTGNRDPIAIKYHSYIFRDLQMNDKAIELLEGSHTQHPLNRELGDQLFYAFVRSNEKLLK